MSGEIPGGPATGAGAGAGTGAGAGAGTGAQRGRPRSAEADRAILAATVDLLAERGLAAMSIEEVAARAGVGKTTIYRRWPSKGLLALDAFVISFRAEQPQPDTGTLRGDLLAALHAWVRAVTQTAMGPMLTGLIAEAQHDPELRGAWRDRVLEPLRTQHRMMLDRAIERGEIPASVDRDVVLDLFFGAAEHRLLLGHLPMTGDFIAEVVDVILSGIVGSPLRHPGRSARPPGARAQRGPLSGRIVATGRVRGSMVHKSLPEARNLPDNWGRWELWCSRDWSCPTVGLIPHGGGGGCPITRPGGSGRLSRMPGTAGGRRYLAGLHFALYRVYETETLTTELEEERSR